jgi:hypothetical protein
VPELGPDLVDRRLTDEDIPTDYEPARFRPVRLEKVAAESEEG